MVIQTNLNFLVPSVTRILGHRVAELEKKLKTLEVSGLWSLQGLCHTTVCHPVSVSVANLR